MNNLKLFYCTIPLHREDKNKLLYLVHEEQTVEYAVHALPSTLLGLF